MKFWRSPLLRIIAIAMIVTLGVGCATVVSLHNPSMAWTLYSLWFAWAIIGSLFGLDFFFVPKPFDRVSSIFRSVMLAGMQLLFGTLLITVGIVFTGNASPLPEILDWIGRIFTIYVVLDFVSTYGRWIFFRT